MLEVRTVVEDAGVSVRDVHCSHGRGGWSDPEPVDRDALVVVLRGAFRRRVEGRWQALDPGYAYFHQAGQHQQFLHPHAGGDRCLSIGLPHGAAAGDLPERAFPAPISAPQFAQVLAAVARSGDGAVEAEEGIAALVARSLRTARRQRASAGAPPSRERIAAAARQALVADPRMSLTALAQRLGCSADHLGRAVAQTTGRSFSSYRHQLRLKSAMERIGEGETDLARVAADTGFADHAHLTRSVRADLGITPSALRQMLR